MELTGSIGKVNTGLKKRITVLLQGLDEGRALTMGALIVELDLDKRFASEVSAHLYRLRSEGKVATFDGPATSPKGRRVVRFYKWVKQVEPAEVKRVLPTPHPLNSLFLRRI